MAYGGKAILSGVIEQYDTAQSGVVMKNLLQIIIHSLTLKGFLVSDFFDVFEQGNAEILAWAKEGKLITAETFYDGFDRAVDAFVGLFKGENIGESLIRVVWQPETTPSTKSEL